MGNYATTNQSTTNCPTTYHQTPGRSQSPTQSYQAPTRLSPCNSKSYQAPQKANPSPRIPSPSLEWNTSQDQWSVDEIESHEEQERTDCFKESSQARLETIQQKSEVMDSSLHQGSKESWHYWIPSLQERQQALQRSYATLQGLNSQTDSSRRTSRMAVQRTNRINEVFDFLFQAATIKRCLSVRLRELLLVH